MTRKRTLTSAQRKVLLGDTDLALEYANLLLSISSFSQKLGELRFDEEVLSLLFPKIPNPEVILESELSLVVRSKKDGPRVDGSAKEPHFEVPKIGKP